MATGGSIPFAPLSTSSFVGWTNHDNDDDDNDDEKDDNVSISSSVASSGKCSPIPPTLAPPSPTSAEVTTKKTTSAKKKKKRKRGATSGGSKRKRSPPPSVKNDEEDKKYSYYTNPDHSSSNSPPPTPSTHLDSPSNHKETNKEILLTPEEKTQQLVSSPHDYKMKLNTQVILQGSAYLTLLPSSTCCNIEIMGYTLQPQKNIYIDSPFYMSALTMTCTSNSSSSSSDNEEEEEVVECDIISCIPNSPSFQICDDFEKAADIKSVITIPHRWSMAMHDILQYLWICQEDNNNKGGTVDEIHVTSMTKVEKDAKNDDENSKNDDDGTNSTNDVLTDAYGNPISTLQDDDDDDDDDEEHSILNVTEKEIMPPHNNRIVICGAKGVGKSTYLRYAINRILSHDPSSSDDNDDDVVVVMEDKTKTANEKASSQNNTATTSSSTRRRKIQKVAVLDCDTGQPEFSPPGLLTLTIVSEPILSPPHAHMSTFHEDDYNKKNDDDDDGSPPPYELIKSYYYGDITSKTNPTFYIQLISTLLSDYQDYLEQQQQQNTEEEIELVPLVINTNGWIKSMGYDILSSIIDAINPKHVVQIVGLTKAKSFDLSQHLVVGNGDYDDDDHEDEEKSGKMRRMLHIVEAASSMMNTSMDTNSVGGGYASGMSTPMGRMSRNASVASLSSLPYTNSTATSAVLDTTNTTTTMTASNTTATSVTTYSGNGAVAGAASASTPTATLPPVTTPMNINANPPHVTSMALRSLRICAYFLSNAYNITSSSSHGNNDNNTKHNHPIQNFTPSDAGLRYLTDSNNHDNKKKKRHLTFHPDHGIVDPSHVIASYLASMKPYIVPFDVIQSIQLVTATTNTSDGGGWNDLYHYDENQGSAKMIINDTMLDALNGSIVGLCYNPDDNHSYDGNNGKSNANDYTDDDNDDTSSSSSHTTNEQQRSTIPPCVGLGVIRSIDRMHKKFYILTPVPFHKLLKVTIFVKGSIQLPMECIFRGAMAESFSYYSCSGVSSGGLPSSTPSSSGMVSNGVLYPTSPVGGDLMEGRNNMKRRYGN